MSKIKAQENIIFVLFVLVAVLSRFVAHSWNFTAVAAVGFAYAMLFKTEKIKSVLLPVVAMLLSDLVIGFHAEAGIVYLSFALAVVPFFFIRPVLATLLGSLVFFLVSNFGVWTAGLLYPKTLNGLLTCYEMAIPFYKMQFLADVIFTPVLFLVTSTVLAKFFQAEQTSLDHNIR